MFEIVLLFICQFIYSTRKTDDNFIMTSIIHLYDVASIVCMDRW